MDESTMLRVFAADLERELLELQGHAPAGSPEGVRAEALRPLVREERVARRERRIKSQRLDQRRSRADALEAGTGETWLRERLSATPWGVPKEIWRARRDREREQLDAEHELSEERAAAAERYAADLAALGAASEPAELITDEQLEKLWRAWRAAVERRAAELLAMASVRGVLCAALGHGSAPATLARAALAELWALPEVPRVAALHAALALQAARLGTAGLGCAERSA